MKRKRKNNKLQKFFKIIKDSPINYFSDLFIVAMVISWIVVLVIMVIVAIYTTMVLSITDMWSEITNLVTIPLSSGGAVWMIKNSVQHAILNKKGKKAPYDFPKIDECEDEIESEKIIK